MKYGLVLRTKKYYGIKTRRLRKCHADFCHPQKRKNIQSHTQLVVWLQNHKCNTCLAEYVCLKEKNELK